MSNMKLSAIRVGKIAIKLNLIIFILLTLNVAHDLEVNHVKDFLRNGCSNGRACTNNKNNNDEDNDGGDDDDDNDDDADDDDDDDNDGDDDDDDGDDDDDDDYMFSKKIRYFFIYSFEH